MVHTTPAAARGAPQYRQGRDTGRARPRRRRPGRHARPPSGRSRISTSMVSRAFPESGSSRSRERASRSPARPGRRSLSVTFRRVRPPQRRSPAVSTLAASRRSSGWLPYPRSFGRQVCRVRTPGTRADAPMPAHVAETVGSAGDRQSLLECPSSLSVRGRTHAVGQVTACGSPAVRWPAVVVAAPRPSNWRTASDTTAKPVQVLHFQFGLTALMPRRIGASARAPGRVRRGGCRRRAAAGVRNGAQGGQGVERRPEVTVEIEEQDGQPPGGADVTEEHGGASGLLPAEPARRDRRNGVGHPPQRAGPAVDQYDDGRRARGRYRPTGLR